MCGINGLIGFSDSQRFVGLMNETIKHRGPNAQGQWSDKNVTLGHRRLSIIDLSKEANQPFVKDGLVVVYNGEIYNFLELKSDLLSRRVKFRTNSDTEVLLELFRLYREQCFNKLLGMFAFCIYDVRTKELFLVRDYFGIKPLYFSIIDNKKLAFSSEIKALINVRGIKKEMNPKALVSCINYLWIYGDESIFKDIKKLSPAHYLYLNINERTFSIKIRRYWELESADSRLPQNEIKDKLKDVLEKSVRRHLISDVPVGSFLSGGLDSSLISVMAKRFNNDLSTYTISIGRGDKRIERMPDDNLYAGKVSSAFGIRHTDVPIAPSIIDSLSNIVYNLDEPIGDPATINTYLICKIAEERGIKVLLSGMGADEIFAGYRRHYATLLANRISNMSAIIKNPIRKIVNWLPVRVGSYGLRQVRWAKRFFSFVDMPMDLAYMRSYSYYNKEELYEIFNHNYNPVIDQMYDDHRDIFYRIGNFDDINKMCYADINMFMTGLNLAYTDKASMAASVEVRVPFIDKEVIELAMSIPGNYKINKSNTKYILKRAAADYLPDYIVNRPKASFGMPLRAWISGDLKKLVDDVLSFENIKKRGFLNPEFVRRIIKRDRDGLEDNAYRIYQFLTLELWFRRWMS